MERQAAQVAAVIRVRNVFHMLAYAFSALTEQGYRAVATEEFDNAAELCAAILERGVSLQLKRGLGQEYVSRSEARSSLRGKIEVTESVKSQALLRRQLVCSYDEFSVDTTMNRVIKATVALLVRSDITRARKKTMSFFRLFLRALVMSERTSSATVSLMTRFIVVSTENSS